MILLILTAAEAKHLAERVEDPGLLDRLCAQLRFDEVFEGVPDEPKTIVFTDAGDGLRVAAVSYQNDAAAEAAFDRFWQTVQADWHRLPLFMGDA